jgi:hypothetical protein
MVKNFGVTASLLDDETKPRQAHLNWKSFAIHSDFTNPRTAGDFDRHGCHAQHRS